MPTTFWQVADGVALPQIVTQTTTWGNDSSSTQLHPATTGYAYQLAITVPTNYQSGQNDCVGDNWIPANGTCGSVAFQGTLGDNYTSSYLYTHLGQLWQGPTNGTGSQQQYLYCNTSQPAPSSHRSLPHWHHL